MVDKQKLQAWWAHRQGLLVRQRLTSPDEVFAKFGWARSVAGCNPYITAFSRAEMTRSQLDQAVADLVISELPSARSCTYVLPKEDFAIGLKMGAALSGSTEVRLARNFGTTDQELESLAAGVLKSLEGGAKEPTAIRNDLGPLVAYYGDEGKKKGLANSLPVALARLQSQGRIVRRPLSGRLDEQRYAYALWSTNPPNPDAFTREEALEEAAKRFYRWIGPASLSQFGTFAAISRKASKAATAPLDLVPIEDGSDLLILKEDLDEFNGFSRPSSPSYRLVNCLDSVLLLHTQLEILFSDDDQQKFATFQESRGANLKELNFNAILDRGEIIGLWEYDVDTKAIAYVTFNEASDDLRKEIEKTDEFVRDQLGDARTFSLDSTKSRRPKIDRLRAGL